MAGEAIVITDKDNLIVDMNRSAEQLTGYLLKYVKGQSQMVFSADSTLVNAYYEMWDSMRRNGFWCGEITHQLKSGYEIHLKVHCREVRNDNDELTHYIVRYNDLIQEKIYQDELFQLANFDKLTGLGNRNRLEQRLNDLARHAHDESKSSLFSILLIDFDRFQIISSTLGKKISDSFLLQMVERLKYLLHKESDFIARISTDEFVVVITHLKSNDIAELVGKAANVVLRKLIQTTCWKSFLRSV